MSKLIDDKRYVLENFLKLEGLGADHFQSKAPPCGIFRIDEWKPEMDRERWPELFAKIQEVNKVNDFLVALSPNVYAYNGSEALGTAPSTAWDYLNVTPPILWTALMDMIKA